MVMKSVNFARNHAFEILDVIKAVAIGGIIIFLIYIQSLNQQSLVAQTQLLQQTRQLALQNRQLSNENSQLLQQLKQSTDSIHSQINCVVEFFTQSGAARTNSQISDPNQCIITTSSSGGAASSNKSG